MASEKPRCVNPTGHPQPCQVCGPVETSDKVSEARQNVIYGGTSQCKCAYTKARERCSTCTIEAVDNLIAAVRAEHYLISCPWCFVDCREQSKQQNISHLIECGDKYRAEHPAAIGHVARCHCLEVALGCDPRTDPRCKPGLLREAEVRLAGLERGLPDVSQKHECYTIKRIRLEVKEARAEVERLREQS